MQRLILAGQGAFYAATGLWSILSIGSFQKVTGPKVDTWLVKTVGALVMVIGAVLMVTARRSRPPGEAVALGAGSALALTAIDMVYALNGRISKVYLLDALAETALAASLVAARALDAHDEYSPSPRARGEGPGGEVLSAPHDRAH